VRTKADIANTTRAFVRIIFMRSTSFAKFQTKSTRLMPPDFNILPSNFHLEPTRHLRQALVEQRSLDEAPCGSKYRVIAPASPGVDSEVTTGDCAITGSPLSGRNANHCGDHQEQTHQSTHIRAHWTKKHHDHSFLMLQPPFPGDAAHGQQTGVRSRRLAATIEIVRQLLSETPAQQICTRTHRAWCEA